MHPKNTAYLNKTFGMKDLDIGPPRKATRYFSALTTFTHYFNKPFPRWGLDCCWFAHRDTVFSHVPQASNDMSVRPTVKEKSILNVCTATERHAGTSVMPLCLLLTFLPPEPPPAQVPFSPSLPQFTGPCSGRGPWGSPFCVLLLTALLTHKPTLQWKPLAAKSQDKEERKIILYAQSHSPNLLLLFKVWPTKWGTLGTMQRKSTSPEGQPTDPISERVTSKFFSCS